MHDLPVDIKTTYFLVFAVFFVLVVFVILANVIYLRKQRAMIIEKNNLENLKKGEILKAQLEIREQTLKTISQEIHDNIGQVLSLAKLNLNTIDIKREEEVHEKIAESKRLVTKAIHDLRHLSKTMNTDNIEAIGLVKSIGYEMDMLLKNGFETHLEVTDSFPRLEPQRELILFRIIQETFNNIIKHAGATEIRVRLEQTANTASIVIHDNGKGFDLSPLNEQSNADFGLGIRNMHSRANLIGGDFSINSTTGLGTTVTLTIPITSPNT